MIMENNMRDISVVVQGAVHSEFTPKCLQSIRKHLPKAYIILSTWEGTNTEGLDFDEVLFSKDPGAIARMYAPERNIGDNPNNINRQIISTLNGLKHVKTKYALKMRTDFEMRHTEFLKYVCKYEKFSNEYRIFKERVISVLGDKPEEKPFFPYDFLFFGLTEDLLKLFDIPLMTKSDAEWFYSHKPINTERYQFIQGLFKYIPEQYIWMNCLAKKYPNICAIMQDCSDVNSESITAGEKSFANNFVCLDFRQYGIYPLKDSLEWLVNENRWHMLHFNNWLLLYKKYCDSSIKIPMRDRYKEELKIEKYLIKLNKHFQNFITPIKKFFRWFCEPISITVYIIKIFIRLITRFYKLF